MQDLSKIVDHASQQSDRWLFIAVLLLLIGGAYLTIKYLVRRDEEKSKRMHDAYDKNTATLMALNVTLDRNNVILDQSNRALSDNTMVLQHVKDKLRRAA